MENKSCSFGIQFKSVRTIKDSNQKAIFIFLAFTMIFSSVVWLLTIHAGSNAGLFGNRFYGYGIMWCPALATLVTCKILGRNLRDLAWGWGSSKYMTWSYLIPFVYALITYTIVWLIGGGGFYNKAYLGQIAHDLGWSSLPSGIFLILFVILQGVIGIIPSMATALGEEIGWRGFLLPEIASNTKSYTKTSLITGAIWALWHYPLLIFGSYNAGGPTWLSLIDFTVCIMSITFVYVWYRLKSKSLWTGVLLHASHNLFVQAVFDPITIENKYTKYYTGEFGVVLPIVSLLIGIYFWTRRKELPAF